MAWQRGELAAPPLFPYLEYLVKDFLERDRETERQRDRETERQRDRETERQRDREYLVNDFLVLQGKSERSVVRPPARVSRTAPRSTSSQTLETLQPDHL